MGGIVPKKVAKVPELLWDGPEDAPRTLVLAHGAGGPMDSPFMSTVAAAIARRGVRVVRFEFPYMRQRRTGAKRPPDREAVLRDEWARIVRKIGGVNELIIGGKSLGGRVASLVADDLGVRALVCLGYPFHPAGKPEKLRTAHLSRLHTPTLICQGTRDPFGTREEIATFPLSPWIRVAYLEDGEHSFKPRKSSGRTEEQNLEEAAAHVAMFCSVV